MDRPDAVKSPRPMFCAGQGWMRSRVALATLLSLLTLGSTGWITAGAAQADLIVTVDPVPQLGDLRVGVSTTLRVKVINRGRRHSVRSVHQDRVRASGNALYFDQGEGFFGNFCSDGLDAGWGDGVRCNVGYGSAGGWHKLAAIPARLGQNYKYLTLRVRPRFRGGYALTLRVDPDNRIPESNDNDNLAAIAIVIR